MTRFSASRDILYSAPPGPDEDAVEEAPEGETGGVEPTDGARDGPDAGGDGSEAAAADD